MEVESAVDWGVTNRNISAFLCEETKIF